MSWRLARCPSVTVAPSRSLSSVERPPLAAGDLLGGEQPLLDPLGEADLLGPGEKRHLADLFEIHPHRVGDPALAHPVGADVVSWRGSASGAPPGPGRPVPVRWSPRPRPERPPRGRDTGTMSGIGIEIAGVSVAAAAGAGAQPVVILVVFGGEVGGDLVDELDAARPDVVVDASSWPGDGSTSSASASKTSPVVSEPCARPFAINPASPPSGRPSRSSADGLIGSPTQSLLLA